MNPIQCADPDCAFELECDTCITGFHMMHVKRTSPLYAYITGDASQLNTLDLFVKSPEAKPQEASPEREG